MPVRASLHGGSYGGGTAAGGAAGAGEQALLQIQ